MSKKFYVVIEENCFYVEEDIYNRNDISLEKMKSLVGCEWLEHLEVVVSGKVYDLWFDEEGKFREKQIITALLSTDNGRHITDYIVGNCLITKSNADGDTLPLDEDDVNNILIATKQFDVYARSKTRDMFASNVLVCRYAYASEE